MIDDDTVYGWAMHYFEEDTILGDLYTEDGELYKPTVPKPTTTYTPTPKPVTAKPKEPSLFDWLEHKDEDEAVLDEEVQETAPLSFTQEPIEEEEQDEVQEETQVQPTVGERQDQVPVDEKQVIIVFNTKEGYQPTSLPMSEIKNLIEIADKHGVAFHEDTMFFTPTNFGSIEERPLPPDTDTD